MGTQQAPKSFPPPTEVRGFGGSPGMLEGAVAPPRLEQPNFAPLMPEMPTVTSPNSTANPFMGTTGGHGGGWAEPVNNCPAVEMYLATDLQCKDAKPGDLADCLADDEVEQHPIKNIYFTRGSCVRLSAENGAAKIVSRTTPITTKDGRSVNAEDYSGELWATYVDNVLEWLPATVEDAGERDIAVIDLGGRVFAGGEEPDKRGFTHNMEKGPSPQNQIPSWYTNQTGFYP